MTQLTLEAQNSLFEYLRDLMEHVQQIHLFDNVILHDQKTQIMKDIAAMLYNLEGDSNTISKELNHVKEAIDSFENNFFRALPSMIQLEIARLEEAKKGYDENFINQKRRNLIVMRNYWEGIPKDKLNQETIKNIDQLFEKRKKGMDLFQNEIGIAEKEASEILDRLSEMDIEFEDGRAHALSEQALSNLIEKWRGVNKALLAPYYCNMIEKQLNHVMGNEAASVTSTTPKIQNLNALLEANRHLNSDKLDSEAKYKITWNPFKAIFNLLKKINELFHKKENIIAPSATSLTSSPSKAVAPSTETSEPSKNPKPRRPAPKRSSS